MEKQEPRSGKYAVCWGFICKVIGIYTRKPTLVNAMTGKARRSAYYIFLLSAVQRGKVAADHRGEAPREPG